jgi:4-aminobutyrate aminotransferase-like enzyme
VKGVFLYNRTTGNVIRLFPPLNIPEDLLWAGIDSLAEIIAGLDVEGNGN